MKMATACTYLTAKWAVAAATAVAPMADQAAATACAAASPAADAAAAAKPAAPASRRAAAPAAAAPKRPCILACGDDVCLMGEGDAEACHTIRIGVPKWQELMVFGGVHGFKGPYDQTRDSGNFGFHEGFNAGFKVPFSDAGYQIGYQAVHSQLHGDKDTDISDPHTQQFVTVGMFRRAKNGIQFGLAWDMLRDERFGAIDFHQLRGELSMIDRGCHEFGLAFAVHLNEHEMFPADEDNGSPVFQATDQYLLFYRFHGDRGGEGRVYGGFNDDEDAIIGADTLHSNPGPLEPGHRLHLSHSRRRRRPGRRVARSLEHRHQHRLALGLPRTQEPLQLLPAAVQRRRQRLPDRRRAAGARPPAATAADPNSPPF